MDQVEDDKLILHQLLLDFSNTPPDHDSEQSTFSGHSCQLIQQNPSNETKWGAIFQKLEESSPGMPAAEMIRDHQLRPSSSSASHTPANTPLHTGCNSALMSSFGNSQIQAPAEMVGADFAPHIDERLSRSNTCPSTPNNTKHHLDYVLDELLMSQDMSYINDHTVAQPSEDHRHQQYQNQQLFKGSNTFSSANYSKRSYAESGRCTPATSASSIKEPLDMDDSNLGQPELNTTANSIDKSGSFTMIPEDHNQQQAQPGDELLDKKRGSKDNLRVKKPKRQRGSKLVIRMKSEVDIVDDGFKWRKYGQKAVKGSPYARNYYKCTDKGCSVKKLVERQSSEPDVVLTTYEGVHTHPSTSPSNYNHSISDLINGTNLDLIYHYTTYLTSLNFIARYIATTKNNNICNYSQLSPPLSSSCLPSFPFINHPTTTPAVHDSTTPLDHQLRHHLLQLLMHHQDIMAERSPPSV